MKLGFLTACLPQRSLADVCRWAAAHDFDALEVVTWPDDGTRPSTARHLNVVGFGEREAHATRSLFDEHDLVCSSIAYYDNNLHPDGRSERSRVTSSLHRAAASLGCPTVGTFVGRDWTMAGDREPGTAAKVFAPLVDRAGDRRQAHRRELRHGGLAPDGYPGNLAYSPELWEWMFSIGLYLNFDPSHLVWMGIDPVVAVKPYVDRIPHAQAKDIELVPRIAAPVRMAWTRPSIGDEPVGRGLVAVSSPRPRRGRLDARDRRARRGRVRGRALGRARGSHVERDGGEDRDRTDHRPTDASTIDRGLRDHGTSVSCSRWCCRSSGRRGSCRRGSS